VDVIFEDRDKAENLRPSQIQLESTRGTWIAVTEMKQETRTEDGDTRSLRTRDSVELTSPDQEELYEWDIHSSDDDERNVIEYIPFNDNRPPPVYITFEREAQDSTSQPVMTDVKESVARCVLKHVGAVLLCEVPIAAVALELDPRTWSKKIQYGSGHEFVWLPMPIRTAVAERARKALFEMTVSCIADEDPAGRESDTVLENRPCRRPRVQERVLNSWDSLCSIDVANNNNDDADDPVEEDLQDEMSGERDESNDFNVEYRAVAAIDAFYTERHEASLMVANKHFQGMNNERIMQDNQFYLHFWNECRCTFPYIYKVMLRVAAAQASNTSSERLFSRASWNTMGRRNRKSGSSLERDVLLALNIDLWNEGRHQE